MNCGVIITTQATQAAALTPSCTGSVRMPIWRSPSMALKSFRVMMPWAPRPYRKASHRMRPSGMAPPSITAAPVIQASVS